MRKHNVLFMADRMRQYNLGKAAILVENLLLKGDKTAYAQGAYDILGQIYLVAGDLTSAKDSFERHLEIYPNNEGTWLYLGLIEEITGNENQAQKCYKKAPSRELEEDFVKKAKAAYAKWQAERPMTISRIKLLEKRQKPPHLFLKHQDIKPEGKTLRVGDTIEGRYEISQIKKGGMGIVYLCYDNEFGEPVAIKTFQDQFLSDKETIDRFIHEANTWIELERHENIVRAYHVEIISDRPYIFLEYIVGDVYYGENLSGWIIKGGLDLKRSLDFAIQICTGIEHAQKQFDERGKLFVHRDIKPENIMITSDRIAKVTDFGLAKTFLKTADDIRLGTLKEGQALERATFTKVGSICGTPAYMSPEQWRGQEDIDIRSDIYSFGCMLYEMLKGRKAFNASTWDGYRNLHLNTRPEGIPSIPEELYMLVKKCLEKVPEQREYSNFKELKKDLSEVYYLVTGEKLKQRNPEDLESWELNNHGLSFINLGRYDEAIMVLDRALGINPQYARAWNNKGLALFESGWITESLEAFENALEIAPSLAEAWNNKGNVLITLGKFKEAIRACDRALSINKRYAMAWYNKGIALGFLERLSEAKEAFQNFVGFSSSQSDSHVQKVKELIHQLRK